MNILSRLSRANSPERIQSTRLHMKRRSPAQHLLPRAGLLELLPRQAPPIMGDATVLMTNGHHTVARNQERANTIHDRRNAQPHLRQNVPPSTEVTSPRPVTNRSPRARVTGHRYTPRSKCHRFRHFQRNEPPSTPITCPVTKLDCSERRNIATSATSEDRPALDIGDDEMYLSTNS